jgi:hypothetical protein
LDGLRKANLLGILVTALLLSFGAPFWYGALRNLLQLRSTLAAKDDAQRTARQASIAAGGTGTAASSGERGDLMAVG